MEKIEQDKEPLSNSELEVKPNLSHDPRESSCAHLDLEEALKVLSKKQRECFNLVIVEGYTEREAAKLLGIAYGVVHIYIRRAKKKLKKLLGGVSQKA